MTPLHHRRDDDLAPGEIREIAPGIRRLLCPNPSPFTFRGTNTWIIGRGSVAVVDPGPANPAHLAAILRAVAGETVSHVVITHTHRDHSPGAAALVAATGAATAGFGPHLTPRTEELGEGGDHGFSPDITMPDGAMLEGADWRLTAVHTPGHCANHISLGIEGEGPEGTLISGDHVMAWSTTVVSPPDGAMAAYMESLERLLARDGDRLYLPGHGPVLPDPLSYVAGLLRHRREREAKVLAALSPTVPMTLEALVPAVYGPIDERLVRGAARSLYAHLLKLGDEGQVVEAGGWRRR
ncbi:glyoxylase-like metal-dependent hydrolase (beta-lactamase superfamily II) [Humitalea rosea]|uniref:Glyoxylase-like metal-dependent hydrolase (Beta-lactamase superfamily II) n=1 Tax=Humitalea rosea TaxID=990373 RepID=A0A2W7HZD6_9PROT|nr:MBL fold metallo-hydrolase [Humitalea rosea]PZW39854.1 glyoxylase-like metal-dependent hydrolase (beta-lactamase superfamily II) [Humitalea rosea]